MAETSKKKPRKSKLVLRECIDLEDDQDLTFEKVEESSLPQSKIVNIPKEETNKQIDTYAALQQLKTKMDIEEQEFEEHNYDEPSSVRFSVEIEVEPCEEKESDKEIPSQCDNILSCNQNCDLPQKEIVISNGVIKNTTKKLMKQTTSIADKLLEIEIRNQWGRDVVPYEETEFDQKIQKVLHDFKMWHLQTKSRGNVLAYKCYICRFGWWNLTPFKQHVRSLHKDVQFVLDTYLHESSIVACEEDISQYSSYIPVIIEGPCWQCQKTFEEHTALKRNSLYYVCEGCNDRFPHCKALFDHEGECAKRMKQITLNGGTTHESYFRCPVCAVNCLTAARHNDHLRHYHCVRSDVPVGMPLMKQCPLCSLKHYSFSLHSCPRRCPTVQCRSCCRKFHSKALMDIHERFTKDNYCCGICNQYLPKHCIAMEHMVRHSAHYVLMHKCTECVDHVLYPTEQLMGRHMADFHLKKTNRKRGSSVYLIVPRECVLHHVYKMDEILADHVAKTQPRMKIAPCPTDADQQTQKKTVRKYTNKRLVIPIPGHRLISHLSADRTKGEENEGPENDKANCEVNMDRTTDASHKSQFLNDHCYFSNENEDQIREDQDKELTDAVRSLGGSQEVDDQFHKEYSKEDEELANAVLFLDRSIKQEIEEIEELGQGVTSNERDDVVFETQVKIKEEKEDYLEIDEATIEEDYEIVDENKLEEGKYEENIENKIETHENEVVDEKTEEHEEVNENKTCIKELSKVFQASTCFKNIKVTGFSVINEPVNIKEEVIVKDEPLDEEEYEEDIITFNDSGPSSSNLDNNSDNEMMNFEPEVNIDTEERDESYDPGAQRKKKQRREYTCTKCNFRGVHKAFREHVRSSCPRAALKQVPALWRDLPCTPCGTSFGTLQGYLEHFTEHDLKSGICPSCFKNFTDIYALQAHFTSHIKMSFLKIQLLRQSAYITSKSSGLFQCRTCSDKVSFGDFFTHWETHFADRESTAGDGERAHELPAHLQGEVGGHTLTADQIHAAIEHLTSPVVSRAAARRCVLCPARVFVRVNDCKRHLVEHLALDAAALRPRYRGLRCQLCHCLFYKSSLYKLHMRAHGALPVFRCEMCDKTFSDSSNFAKHKKVHNLRVMICDICQKKFHSKAGLTRHLEIHKTTKPSTCYHCDKVFTCPSAYKRHLKHVQSAGSPRFRCRVCRVYFPSLKQCWDHMWDVHKERKFKADCPVCNKSFRKFQDVRRHVRKAHHHAAIFLPRKLTTTTKTTTTTRTTTTTTIKQDVEEFLSNTAAVRLHDAAETLIVYD